MLATVAILLPKYEYVEALLDILIPYSRKITRAPIFKDFKVFVFLENNFILEIFCPNIIAKLTAKLCNVTFS